MVMVIGSPDSCSNQARIDALRNHYMRGEKTGNDKTRDADLRHARRTCVTEVQGTGDDLCIPRSRLCGADV